MQEGMENVTEEIKALHKTSGAPERIQDCHEQGKGQSRELQPQVLFGYCLMRGALRASMEDVHLAEFRIVNGAEVGIFGVFDGHGGKTVASYLQHRLFDNIFQEGGFRSDPVGATRDGYLLTDEKLLDNPHFNPGAGSTAVTAMIIEHGARLVVANIGDARAVLCKDGVAVQLSVDHYSGNPKERANVELKGGLVTTIPGDIPRVDGVLSVARAFGDKSLKEHMSAKPDVCDYVVDLSCQLLILASNGIWDCVSNQEAVDLIKDIADPMDAATILVREARRRRSSDDIACIVIRFREL